MYRNTFVICAFEIGIINNLRHYLFLFELKECNPSSDLHYIKSLYSTTMGHKWLQRRCCVTVQISGQISEALLLLQCNGAWD